MTATIRDEIQRVFELQMENCRRVSMTSVQERRNKLDRLLKIILKHRQQIKEALYADFRKSGEEVDLTEIYPVLTEIRYTIKHLRSWMKPAVVRNSLAAIGAKSKVIYQPKGVCLIISPWNYPFQLSIGPLISALAAGNCVVIKPSEFSPHTSELLKKLLHEAFEENEVDVFQGDQEIAQALLGLPFHHVYFTGSPSVGKIIMAAAAQNLASITLELGGKSPVVIDGKADLEMAARRILWGKLINAGQTCIAPDYVLIPEDRKDDFIQKAIEVVRQYYGPLEELKSNADYCRIINRRHVKRMKAMIDEAVDRGGELILGGDVDEEDLFIAPTLILNPPLHCTLMQEEIFGPVLPLVTFKRESEVLSVIEARPRPLVLYIFSPEKEFIEHILERTHSGDVVINDVVTHYANIQLPFGGVNNSGIGKTHGMYGFKEFSHLRSVMRRGKVSPARLFYPPYNQTVKRMIDLLLKYL